MTDRRRFDPARAVLLILDLQRGVLESTLGSAFAMEDTSEMLERVRRLRRSAELAGIDVVQVRFALSTEARNAIPGANKSMANVSGGDYFAEGGPDVELDPAAGASDPDRIFTKCRTGAFSSEDLRRFLTDRSIDTLILAGVHTSGVILSTVREAADLDFRLIVIDDCCADHEPDVHELLMTRIFPLQADVLDVEHFESYVQEHGTG